MKNMSLQSGLDGLRLSCALVWLSCVGAAPFAEAGQPCFAPSGEWITGADLAAVMPGLAALPADLKVSYAPIPGLTRIFHPDELRRLAHAHGLPDPAPGSIENVCAAWPLTSLAPETLRQAMEKTLAGHGPQIELLGQDKAEAPRGEVIFPLSGSYRILRQRGDLERLCSLFGDPPL